MYRHTNSSNLRRLLNTRRQDRRAFTLIELMTVMAILGMLMAMLIPAVQEVRESMRKATCRNNLSQLGTAALLHRTAMERFPSGGWGYRWAGDADLGNGRKQPGGWMFSIIPYLEMQDVFEKNQGISDAEKRTLAAKILSREMELFLCPSRRPPRAYPITSAAQPINSDSLAFAARTDYAINAGDQAACQFDGGPVTIGDGTNPDWWKVNAAKYDTSKFTGISFTRSEIKLIDITDGHRFVYLIAEKYVDPANYLTGTDPGDLYAAYAGFGPHAYRTGASPPLRDNTPNPPANRLCSWGSPHAVSFNAVFCDASVRSVRYGIGPDVHANLANRKNRDTDGQIDPSEDKL